MCELVHYFSPEHITRCARFVSPDVPDITRSYGFFTRFIFYRYHRLTSEWVEQFLRVRLWTLVALCASDQRLPPAPTLPLTTTCANVTLVTVTCKLTYQWYHCTNVCNTFVPLATTCNTGHCYMRATVPFALFYQLYHLYQCNTDHCYMRAALPFALLFQLYHMYQCNNFALLMFTVLFVMCQFHHCTNCTNCANVPFVYHCTIMYHLCQWSLPSHCESLIDFLIKWLEENFFIHPGQMI